MSQPVSADRICNDRTLVADDRILDARLECIAADRLEHAPGDEDDVDARLQRALDCRARARAQDRVLRDQRAVEVAGDRVDLAREVLREVQPCGFVRKSTRAVRSAGGRDA